MCPGVVLGGGEGGGGEGGGGGGGGMVYVCSSGLSLWLPQAELGVTCSYCLFRVVGAGQYVWLRFSLSTCVPAHLIDRV